MFEMKYAKIIETFIEEVFNKGDLEALSRTVHPRYRYSSPSETMNGIAELAGLVIAFRLAFPDLRIGACEQLESGESVVTRVRISGTHLGEFLGMAATGESVDVEGCIISEFRDDRLVREWEILDQLTLLQQLGAAA